MPVSKKRKKKKKKGNNKLQTGNKNHYLEAKERVIKSVKNSAFSKDIKFGQFEDSVSGLILDFGKDYLDRCVTNDEYLKIVPFIILSWNLGTYKEEEREAKKREFSKGLDLNLLENELQFLIDRKIKYFDQYKYIIIEYDISFPKNEMYLEVASAKMDS